MKRTIWLKVFSGIVLSVGPTLVFAGETPSPPPENESSNIQERGISTLESQKLMYQQREQTASPAMKRKLAAFRTEIQSKGLQYEVGYTGVADRPLKNITGFKVPSPQQFQDALAQEQALRKQFASQETRHRQAVQTKLSQLGSTGQVVPRGLDYSSLPAFNWTDPSLNAVTPAKDQGVCGSCVIFAEVGALESGYLIEGQVPSTNDGSEQFPLDSDPGITCAGNLPSTVAQFLQTSGTVSEADDPYQAFPAKRSAPPNPNAPRTHRAAFWMNAPLASDITFLKQWLTQIGPILVSIVATDRFQLYTSGVFSESVPANAADHAVLLIGWDDARQAWRIKNSYGTMWGEYGFAWVRYGSNNVGYYATAVIPLLPNGEVCNGDIDCVSKACYPFPPHGNSYCMAQALNCAVPGGDGARYGNTPNLNGSGYTCSNPGDGRATWLPRGKANGLACGADGDCQSQSCYPYPPDNTSYCNARTLNCAVPNGAGAVYGERRTVGSSVYECRNPQNGQRATWIAIGTAGTKPNGVPCSVGSECSSGACYPSPPEGSNFCMAQSANCALPGGDGVSYGTQRTVNGVNYMCVNPGNGPATWVPAPF